MKESEAIVSNPPAAKIFQLDRPPIVIFRRDYWPDGKIPTPAEFRRKIQWHALRLSSRLRRSVQKRIVRDRFAQIFI